MIVNIKYVNPPGPQSSGKYGNIVTQTGEKIYVPVDLLDLFKTQTTVEIKTKEQTWGTTPVTIAASGPMDGHTGAVQGQGVQSGYQRPVQGYTANRANTGFQPRVVQGGAGRSTDQGVDRNMFITGVVGRAMGSGKFTASEIPVLTQAAHEAYDRLDRLLRGVPAEPPPEPLGDPGPELQ